MNAMAVLEKKLESPALPVAARRGFSPLQVVACAGATVYGLGMLSAMLWSSWTGGNWPVLLLALPGCALAVLFGAGAMAGALLAPDPYVHEPGHAPGKLPDFS